MPQEDRIVSRIYIKISGTEIQSQVMANVQEVIVDQHTHLPGMFTIRLFDKDLEYLDDGPFDLAKEIEIGAYSVEGDPISLIKGEITALEPHFGEGMLAELLIRGYDKSHRLYRQTKSTTFLNIKDSDVASQIAGAVGLQTQVDATSTVYDHLYQHNQTDMTFIMQRAWRIGFECFVEDGKLYFRKPPSGSAALTLTWGEDLLSFDSRMTLAEQVDEVIVKGWDPEQKEAIIGQASNGDLYPQVGQSRNGASLASAFGTGKTIIVDMPVVSQPEAAKVAQARLDEISGSFIEAEGEAFRRPELKAGRLVQLEGLGTRLSGSYLVTHVRHIYSPEGLKTTFAVRGTRTGSLAEQVIHQAPVERWPGIVPAVVTNTNDPKKWGRVKVKFPWMSDEGESAWARVISAGAGPEAGYYVIPQVADEVMVAFEHGDFNYPYVLGGVWNGQDKIPPEGASAGSGDEPLVRVWRSAKGHVIAMYDNQKKLDIITTGGHTITLDDQNKKLEIKSSGGNVITVDDNARKVTVKSGGDVVVEGQTNVNIKAGGNMSLEATGNVNIKATGMLKLEGSMVNIN
jgi:phage protein D/phage baseplate assembly protein gpV